MIQSPAGTTEPKCQGPRTLSGSAQCGLGEVLSISVTILREQERRQFGWFKRVFLILDGLLKGPPSEESAFPKVCSVEHETQKFLREGGGFCVM